MKRLALVLVLALTAAACGGSDATAPATDPTPTADTATAPSTDDPTAPASPSTEAVATPSTPSPASSPPASTEAATGTSAGGAPGIATVVVDGGATHEFELTSCMTSATDPDSFLLPDSFQVYGEADGLGLTADWLSANGDDYFGTGSIGAVQDSGGIATFEPGDLTTTDGTVSGDVTLSVLGDVEGIPDGSTASITFTC